MADVSDNSAFSLGMANIAQQNYGPNAIAAQASTNATTANTNASTALTNQQAQGAAIQNNNARLQYQLFRQGMSHLMDFSGQPQSPSVGAAEGEASGVTAASAAPGAGAPAAVASSVNPEDEIGSSAANQGRIDAWLEQKYNVNPAGTDAEQQAILAAHAQAVQMKLSGNKGLADAAEEKVQMLIAQRDMGVASRKNAAAVDASDHYDKFAAIESAPDGQAFSTLNAVYPETAAKIIKTHPDATPEELEEITRDTTSHAGAFMHRFTNRPVKVGDDGATYDEQSGMRVDVPIRGVSPEKQTALIEQANHIVTTKNSDGTETTEPQYKKDGYSNPNLWVTDQVAQIRARNATNNTLESVANQAITHGHIIPGAPPGRGGTLYRGPQDQQPSQQPGAPQQQPGQPGQPGQPPQSGQPRAQPGQQPGAGPTRPQQPPVDPVLKNALNDPEFKLPVNPVQKYVGQSPSEQKEQEAIVSAKQDLFKDSADATSASASTLQYLQAAKAIMTSKGAPTVGITGQAANQVSRALNALGYKSLDATNYAEVAKYLGNAALSNAKATYGAKMTQSEVKLQLEDLSPSTQMTDSAINSLINTNIAAAKYTIDSARYVRPYLALGGDPRSYAIWRETHFPRAEAVNGPPAQPSARPGQQSSGGGGAVPTITSQSQYDSLPSGASYTDASGKPHVKGGR